MTRYRIYAAVTGTKYLGIHEGDTPEEAIDNALVENDGVNLCYHCSSEVDDAQIGECHAEPMTGEEDET